MIGDWKRQVIDLARQRSEAFLVRNHLAGERHGHVGAPVEPADEGNDMLDRLTTMVVTEVEEALALIDA